MMLSNSYKNNKPEVIKPCPYIGKFMTLSVKRYSEHGVYLSADNYSDKYEDEILLPKKEQPEGLRTGSEIKVFIYRDSSDRPIATVREPKITIDRPAVLKVVEKTRIGAFLDFGFEKHLLLPFHEMTSKIEPGMDVLVRMYVDRSDRLVCSQKHLYKYLSTSSPYLGDEKVYGRVYEFSKSYGTYLAIDDRYSAMIGRHEDTSDLSIGDIVEVTIKDVKEDGKLDVTRRGLAYSEIDSDADKIYSIISGYNGELPFSDHASPELIKKETGLSKAAFKRAIGKLYKERKIIIKEEKILLNK